MGTRFRRKDGTEGIRKTGKGAGSSFTNLGTADARRGIATPNNPAPNPPTRSTQSAPNHASDVERALTNYTATTATTSAPLPETHPDIAAQAYGWDPTTTTHGSQTKRPWKCTQGHIWTAPVCRRTASRSGCPICANRLIIRGINDLTTTHPDLAAEYHPTKNLTPAWELPAGTAKKLWWKCTNCSHEWEATGNNRTTATKPTACPACANRTPIAGMNDLATQYPHLALEADGWDPTTITSGSAESRQWKCTQGHTWTAPIKRRTRPGNPSGCPECANSSFNPGVPTTIYLQTILDRTIRQPLAYKIGITANFERRHQEQIAANKNYIIENLARIEVPTGRLAKQIETSILNQWRTEGHSEAFTKEQLPDGYTETVSATTISDPTTIWDKILAHIIPTVTPTQKLIDFS
jgi:DNA-directed RNA polymerase subunit RPC12/RpoP